MTFILVQKSGQIPCCKINNDSKKTQLNPQRWKLILTLGFITKLHAAMHNALFEKVGVSSKVLSEPSHSPCMFPILYFFHFCNLHLHSKASLFPDGILPASLWLPSGRIALHLPPRLQPDLLQLSVSNMKQGDSSCSFRWGSLL